MASVGDKRVFDALALPSEALNNGGAEILRVGIIDNELYVTARRAFKDPARWGEVLADIARELAIFHSAEDTALSEQEILTEIEQAFAADLGAPAVEDDEPPPKQAKPAKPAADAKPKVAPAKGKSAKKAKPKSAAKAKTKSAAKPTKSKRR